jgi:hypothetical protein
VEFAILLACEQGDVHSPAGTTGFRLAPGSFGGMILPGSLCGLEHNPTAGVATQSTLHFVFMEQVDSSKGSLTF